MDIQAFIDEWQSDSPYLAVHTSGSTGKPKEISVEKQRMENSARQTCDFLKLKAGSTALLCMSLDYIAGKMMVVRALTCQLQLLAVSPSGHPLDSEVGRQMDEGLIIDFAAMVPLQVYNSLQVPEERRRLMQIRHLIIGGGAVDESLAAELATFPHAVWSTYGMTETVSHIALRRLNGPEADSWYRPFDGVKVWNADDGCLMIDAPQLCAQVLKTNDIAEVQDGRFRILGRLDNVICSGGIKIQIEEVERALKPYMSSPFVVTKVADEKFGEVEVLLTESSELVGIQCLCERHLQKYHIPRHYYCVDRIPLTETGKPARKKAEMLAANLRSQQLSE